MATAKIQILSDGPMRGRTFMLSRDNFTIGRSESCDICIPDSTISGHHCSLRKNSEGGFVLCDDGSTNGTHVNGASLEIGQEQVLKHGDVLQFGSVEVLFDSGEVSRQQKKVQKHKGPVIDLENTGTSDYTSTQLRNMSGTVTTKRPVILRENKYQVAFFITVIVALAVVAVWLFFKNFMMK